MKDYLLYPGCSMEYSARAYSRVAEGNQRAARHAALKEIEDWNCCGATEYLGISRTPAYALIARNLAIAAKDCQRHRELVAPCSACYLNLAKADHYMERTAGRLGSAVNEALAAGELAYDPGSLKIRHLLDVMVNDVGLDDVEKHVVQPLSGPAARPLPGLHGAATRLRQSLVRS